jgi:hypothetical protein
MEEAARMFRILKQASVNAEAYFGRQCLLAGVACP